MTSPGSASSLGRRPSEPPPWPQRIVQGIVRALWQVVIPALLAGVVLRFLVPAPGPGLRGIVAIVGKSYPVPFRVVLFLMFSAVARYWRFALPGGRYASDLPADMAPNERDGGRLGEWERIAGVLAALRSKRVQRDLERREDPRDRAAVFEQRARLVEAVDAEDLGRARAASAQLASLLAAPLEAQKRRSALGLAALLAGLACAAAGVRMKVVEPYQVASSSMIPALQSGDRVVGRKVDYSHGTEPRRGDVVAFRSSAVEVDTREEVPDVLLKRVIGLPGDRIAMVDGVPVINGWTVPVCKVGNITEIVPDGSGSVMSGLLSVEFLGEHAYLTVRAAPVAAFDGPYVVQPGEVFVLGDNRNNSIDSRAYRKGRGGGVPLQAIEARVNRFLAGTDRSGETDFSPLMRPLGVEERALRSPTAQEAELQRGISECLGRPPETTMPPVASEESGADHPMGPT